MLTRREVIWRYVRYDRAKKDQSELDMSDWDWASANALDAELESRGLKHGIIAGYKTWEHLTFGRHELARCAIVNGIAEFQGLPRVLGQLAEHAAFKSWQPNRATTWYARLRSGGDISGDEPLLVRPSVEADGAGARWYVEDGTGRAMCLYRRLTADLGDTGTAAVLLGREPDSESQFMQTRFHELLT